MREEFHQFDYYPREAEIDAWLQDIWDKAELLDCREQMLEEQGFSIQSGVRHLRCSNYVQFTPEGMSPFYGYWQQACSTPAPLVIHVPGYGADFCMHPDIAMQGFNVLHVNPLGYVTPWGADVGKERDNIWPVLPDTICSNGENGYKQWLINCVLAVRWAQKRGDVLPERISFFGASQGGAGAVMLGSLFQNRGVRCVAADVPFLTNFPLALKINTSHAYQWAGDGLAAMGDNRLAWHGLGFVDTLSHAHRLTVPVMLTAGGNDECCPPATVLSLFEKLPATKMYCYIDKETHRCSTEFAALAAAWFRLYA